MKSPASHLSCSQATAIRWTHPRCLIVGFLPDFTICIIAWLSSWKYKGTSPLNNTSQKLLAGIPMAFIIVCPVYHSDSGVELVIAECFDDFPHNGKHEFWPMMAKWPPPVDRWVTLHPAKSASAKICGAKSSALSPIHPICR